MPQLRFYVAEIFCGDERQGFSPHRETWTIMGHGIADARRRLKTASGRRASVIAPISNLPQRHWRAG